jgi:hypothetical protein
MLQVLATTAETFRLAEAVPAKAGFEIRVLLRARVEPIRAAVRTEQREESILDMI